MRSAFFELGIANSGLFSAQAGINVSAHNIANRNTAGYSRQVSLQSAGKPLSIGSGFGMVGTGSIAFGVGQIRNTYLDGKFWRANSSHCQYSAKNEELKILEAIFAETDETGLSSSVDRLFSSISRLTESAGDMSFRTSLIQNAKTLTQYINDRSAALLKQQKDINSEVKLITEQINNLGRQIQSLNSQIFISETDGSAANDLRDKRALLIDELSSYVNVEAKETKMDNGEQRFFVSINGHDFVNHMSMNELTVRERADKINDGDANGLYDVYWAQSGVKFNSKSSLNTMSGSLKGVLEMRDGNNTTVDGKGVPHFMERLNVFARTLARLFNEGTDLSGKPIEGIIGHRDAYFQGGAPNTGLNFFSYYTDEAAKLTFDGMAQIDYDKITAANFTVSAELLADAKKLAAGLTQNAEQSDAGWAVAMLSAKHNGKVFDVGEIGNYIGAVVGELAVDAGYASAFESKYVDIKSAVDNQRISVSGVDENEEMSKIISFQQTYQALARLINVINSVYDTLIKGT